MVKKDISLELCFGVYPLLQHIDFGTVSVGSSVTHYVTVTNTLDQPIHFVFDMKSVPELKTSEHQAQVIPAGGRAKFPLTLVSSDVKIINEKVGV